MQTARGGDGEAALGGDRRAARPTSSCSTSTCRGWTASTSAASCAPSDDLPILFLSSRDDEIDRVLGLELGGDDYVVKPFSPREVVARVSAILKRGGRALEEAGAAARRSPTAGCGSIREAWEAHWDGAPVPLTVTEFQLLLLLASLPSQGVQPRRDHRPAARPRLRHHRPHDRQPYPQPARQVRGRWAAPT